jgi:hypothetical protein
MRRGVWRIWLVLTVSSLAHACSCGGPNPICSSFWQSPAIFRGTVVELTLLRDVREVKNLDGTTSSIVGPGKYKVRFRVSETFRGEAQEEIAVYTADQGSACGFPFKNGVEYIVFTYENKTTGELSTSSCSSTHAFDPTKEDGVLSWMRGFSKAPAGAMIFGFLRVPSDGKVSPPTRVSLRGAESRDLIPDEKGAYSVAGLLPGQYTVSATVPPGFSTGSARTVSVQDKGCAEVDWRVYYDSHIRGRVRDTSGTPLANISVELLHQDTKTSNGFDGRGMVNIVQTDTEGRYDFVQAAPGEYIVAANMLGPSPTRPYPLVYFPDAETLESATAVKLGASAVLEDVDITLPKAWKAVVVHTRVVLQNGSSAVHADVHAHDAHDASALWWGEPAMAVTDADGRAELTVYEGRTYYLTALISGGTQQRCAGPLKFTAKDGMSLETIRIEHNWGNCLAQLNPKFTPPR